MTDVSFGKSKYIKFRPDIDGMRTVAVLSVIIFHMGFTIAPGGYVGVDIFFVISGFLITQDIVNRIGSKNFSIIEFYLRRARRIFPALFVVLFLSSVAAYFVLTPAEFTSYGKSLIGAATSLSNIIFYRRDSYFGAASEETPLLHTWSLGVEEQFYIFWPVLLIVACRFLGRKGVVFILFIIVGASLTYSQAILSTDPSFSYFMLPTRAWELAIGGILGLVGKARFELGKQQATALSVAGFVLLGYAFLNFTEQTPFPGLNALIPVCGTALILFSGQYENPMASLLSGKIVTYVGRLSYPLYLVHWPIIVFWSLSSPSEINFLGEVVQIILMFVSAFMVVTFIEPIIRRIPAKKQLAAFWAAFVMLPIFAIVIVSVVIIRTNGLPMRHEAPEWIRQSELEARKFQANPCLMRDGDLPKSQTCFIGDENTSPTIVLWGDSHAAQLIPVFRSIVAQEGYSGLILTKAGCAPIPNVTMLPNSDMRSQCREFNENVLDKLNEIPNLRGVILAGRWSTYVSGSGLLSEANETVSLESSRRLFSNRLQETAETIQSRGAIPILAMVAPVGVRKYSCAARAAYFGRDEKACNQDVFELEKVHETVLEALAPEESLMPRLPILSTLCSDGKECDLFGSAEYGLLDNAHLSQSSALLLLSPLQELLE